MLNHKLMTGVEAASKIFFIKVGMVVLLLVMAGVRGETDRGELSVARHETIKTSIAFIGFDR